MTQEKKFNVDDMNLEEIISHKWFFSFEVDDLPYPPYSKAWKVVLKSDKQVDEHRWLTIDGEEVIGQCHCYFKKR